jgi:hypothetical protein
MKGKITLSMRILHIQLKWQMELAVCQYFMKHLSKRTIKFPFKSLSIIKLTFHGESEEVENGNH